MPLLLPGLLLPSAASCSSDTTDERGRIGIGIAQPQSGTDYPFVEPSEDVRYLVADLYFSYDDPSDYPPNLGDAPFRPPFRVDWLYGIGCAASDAPAEAPTPTHAADLTIVDADGVRVFDSTGGTHETRTWGPRLAIHSWETADAVCRIVVHTAWPPTGSPEPRDYPLHLSPESAVIDHRAFERRPKRVKSLKVLLTTMTKLDVDFREGSNMRVLHEGATVVNGGRRAQRISFAAIPGAGTGLSPGCDPEPLYIRTIRGIRPTDAGDYYVSATDCFWVRQPSSVVQEDPRILELTPAMLQVGSDCVPCCSCDDYVDVALYLNSTRARYQTLGNEFNAINVQYSANRERWLAARECFYRAPLRLLMQAQYCPVVDVVAQFCNQSDQCVGPLAMTIDLTDTTSPGEVVTGYTFIMGATTQPGRRSGRLERYNLSGAWPIFQAFWPAVEPFASVHVRFRLRFDAPCAADAPTAVVNGCVTGTIAGEPIMVPGPDGPVPASGCNTEAVDCPPIFERVDPYRC